MTIVDVRGQPTGCYHSARPYFRYIVLVLICLLTFGSYFCYDIPSAVKKQYLDEKLLGLSQLQFNLLYSLYSWPNTVQVFLGGFLIDRYFGVRLGSFFFAACCCVGQVAVAIGCWTKVIPIIYAGRFLFGIGGESLSVAQSTFIARWFRGNELAMAFGIALSFSRVGSAVNFDIEPSIAGDDHDLDRFVLAMWVGVGTTVLSLLCCVWLWTMDRRGEKQGTVPPAIDKEVAEEDQIHLSDVFSFPGTIWLIYLITICFYVSVYVFLQNGVDFLSNKYEMSSKRAGFVMSLPYTISAIASPFLGFAVDKLGRALVWIVFAQTLLVGCHACLAYTFINPIYLVCGIGIAYSVCAAALWPSVALIVQANQLGTAYGLMTALQNLGLAVTPLIIAGLLPNSTAGHTTAEFAVLYRPMVEVLGGIAAASLMTSIVLVVWDAIKGGALNASAARIAQKHEALEGRISQSINRHSRFSHMGSGEQYGHGDWGLSDPTSVTVRNAATMRAMYLARLGIRTDDAASDPTSTVDEYAGGGGSSASQSLLQSTVLSEKVARNSGGSTRSGRESSEVDRSGGVFEVSGGGGVSRGAAYPNFD